MDRIFLDFFNQTVASPFLDLMMPIITVYGLYLLPLAGIILYLSQFYSGQFSVEARKLGAAILVALAVGLTLTFTFYYLALRPRPNAVRLIMPQPNFPSFPSGHTVLAFSTATILILFAWDGKVKNLWWKISGCCSILLAILIALSRVYLGHHYPTDIVAGSVLGTATGAAIFGLLLVDEKGIRRFRWLLWVQIAVAILVTMMAYLNLLPVHLLRWPYADKVLHFLLFGAITFWLYLWMPSIGIRIGRWFLPMAILLPITIAFFEELLQGTSSLRTASLADLGFDLAGMICFCLLARWLLLRDARVIPLSVTDAVE